jgi:hypothetical protein
MMITGKKDICSAVDDVVKGKRMHGQIRKAVFRPFS